jgi:hypothetical protein
MGFMVFGLELRVGCSGFGFRIQCLGLRFQVPVFRIQNLGFRVDEK